MIKKQVATVPERIREAMDYRGLRQMELVERTGISKSLLNQYIHGRVKNITSDKVYLIAKALGVSETWLMGLDVDMLKPGQSEVDFVLDDKYLEKLGSMTKEQREKVYAFIDFVYSQK